MRLYLDESGSAGRASPKNPSTRYLGLVGAAIPQDGRHQRFCERFQALKRDHLAPIHDADRDEDPCILHREDMVKQDGPYFSRLKDAAARAKFDAALLKAIEETDFILYGVVLDKVEHQAAEYRSVKDEYVYCLEAMLERYCGRMARKNCVGDVMAENRGRKEDVALKAAYKTLVTEGGRFFTPHLRKRLTSVEIKVKPKASNVLGLQLADLLARDVTREILASRGLCPEPKGFAAELQAVLAPKYNRQLYTGRITGYGHVFLT